MPTIAVMIVIPCGMEPIISNGWGATYAGVSGQDCFDSGTGGGYTSNRCDLTDVCVYNNSDHDMAVYCSDVCEEIGYNTIVYYQTGSYLYWTCACTPTPTGSFTEWQTYKTGVLRRYELTAKLSSGKCVTNVVALNEYKCAPGYYGPNNSTTGCKTCPANARCSGGTGFSCNEGYYINSTGTACPKCPDSKEGGLGWDENGNGIPAVGGVDELEWCNIPRGTVLYDATGTLQITMGAYDGCEYAP